MKSTAHDYGIKGLRRQIALERRKTTRGVLSRGRKLDATMDISQLPVASVSYLCNSSGQFYFIVGLSIVGGPDIMR